MGLPEPELEVAKDDVIGMFGGDKASAEKPGEIDKDAGGAGWLPKDDVPIKVECEGLIYNPAYDAYEK
ncbi:hypothetical protein LTR66_013480 [Elasticomyces elasticus]|nr:hypothetical protein LTR66_013480 [Elasticomyces elasticus]